MTKTALLVIDMQMLMVDRVAQGRDCINADAPDRLARLLAGFRAEGRPVIHILHHERDPAAELHADAPASQPIPQTQAVPGEPVFIKHTSSAFASTGLERVLRDAGITDLAVTGAVAGFCVNSTVRAGADLGFRMQVIRDAVMGFDLPTAGLSAQTIFDVTMAHLAADFARLVDTGDLLAG